MAREIPTQIIDKAKQCAALIFFLNTSTLSFVLLFRLFGLFFFVFWFFLVPMLSKFLPLSWGGCGASNRNANPGGSGLGRTYRGVLRKASFQLLA